MKKCVSDSARDVGEAVEFVIGVVLKFGKDCLRLHFCGLTVLISVIS